WSCSCPATICARVRRSTPCRSRSWSLRLVEPPVEGRRWPGFAWGTASPESHVGGASYSRRVTQGSTAPPGSTGVASSGARVSIVTVDDDGSVSRAIARDLRRRYADRYRIVRAESGPQALDA